MYSDVLCMKSSFFVKREEKRTNLQNDASLMEHVLKMQADDLDSQYKRVFKVEDRIANINIIGPLSPDGPDTIDVYFGYGGTAYKNIIRAANESKSLYDSGEIDFVKIKMNTPGGSIDQLDQAYQALQQIANIGTVYNEGIIASAGVWLASAFDNIIPATNSSQIGSIGVVANFVDYDGYYDNFGIKVYTITNDESPNKRPNLSTKEGVDVIKRELNDLYNVFVSKVTASRPITRKKIDSLRGEMVIAEKAVEIGLMDKPRNEKYRNNADADSKKTNEKEVLTMSDENKTEIKTITEDEHNLSLENERKRIAGLIAVEGVSLSEKLEKAILEGTDLGTFAIDRNREKQADAKAEVEAARNKRKENKDQDFKIEGSQHGEDIEESNKLQNEVKKYVKKKGGVR